jgi:hypothetical protein
MRLLPSSISSNDFHIILSAHMSALYLRGRTSSLPPVFAVGASVLKPVKAPSAPKYSSMANMLLGATSTLAAMGKIIWSSPPDTNTTSFPANKNYEDDGDDGGGGWRVDYGNLDVATVVMILL